MATITYDITTPFGKKVYAAVQAIRLAQANIQRVQQVAMDMTSGGNNAQLVNLEASPQFGVKVGQGAAFYAALTGLSTVLFITPATWTSSTSIIDLDMG